jgi:hypothetical protein
MNTTEKNRQIEILNSLTIDRDLVSCELANTDREHKKYYFLNNELAELTKAISEKLKFIETI